MMNKKFIKAFISFLSVLSIVMSAGAGITMAAEKSGDNMKDDKLKISFSSETGKISALKLYGKDMLATADSGFTVTDYDSGETYDFNAKLSGKGEMKQNAAVGNSGLTLKATYKQQGNVIRVDAVITDTTGKDRNVRVKYSVPVKSTGMFWYSDTEDKILVQKGGQYSTVVENGLQGHEINLYPYSVISNGNQALAMAVPMDPPLANVISYDMTSGNESMIIKYDFTLSKKTKKSPSKAEFSFLIYAPDEPEWGFRSATQKYYDLFPEYFEVKSDGGGNWLFQHAYDQIDGVEDFSFGYNETPGSYKFDDQNNVASFQYTAPAEQWMSWPGQEKEKEPTYDQYMQRFLQLQNTTAGVKDTDFLGIDVRDVAEALKNSAIVLGTGKYLTSGWYVYGETVCFTTNHNPDIEGFNSYKLQINNIVNAEKKAKEEGSLLDGVYIDNLAGLGTYNYRTDHFETSDLPLLWDANKNAVLPTYSSMYSYTKAIRKRCDENNQLVMANMVFPERGSSQYVYMVDAIGSEVGPSWGWDPYIQRLRRTLAYRKPWMLLLGHDLGTISTSASSCPISKKEEIMKSAVAYGLYANVIGYRVPMSDYESSRPLFRKYTPIVDIEDKLGWCPVPYAKATDSNVNMERFGELKSGAAVFTAYNIDAVNKENKISIDLNALGVDAKRQKKLIAFEMIDNTIVPIEIKDGIITYTRTLNRKDVSAVIIGTKEEIWELLYTKIDSNIQRAVEALKTIPDELDKIADIVPDQWEDLEKHVKALEKLNKGGSAKTLKKLNTLVSELSDCVNIATSCREEMLNFTEKMDINMIDICGDSLSVASGFNGKPISDNDTDTDTSAPKEIDWNEIIIISSAAIVAVAALSTTLFLVVKKAKSNNA